MSRWPKYVPVAQRRAKAQKKLAQLKKKGLDVSPVETSGRKITTTFWGNSWCDHLEKFSDYANRLPRGRTYVRNGSVCHLQITKGHISAMVAGSKLYKIEIEVDRLPARKWSQIKKSCAGQISSMLELLQGKISEHVMRSVVDKEQGLFPKPGEIHLSCNCPDWAELCKHLAAVLYGVGSRLDQSPELLFLLRGVDHNDLIQAEIKIPSSQDARPEVGGDLSDIFDIELDDTPIRTVKKSAAKKSTKPKRSIAKKALSTRKINISRGIRASHIVHLRKKLDVSQKEFAQLLNKSPVTVCSWEEKKGVLKLQANNQLLLEKIFATVEEEEDNDNACHPYLDKRIT